MARPRARRPERAAQYENPTYRALVARLGANLRAMRQARGWTMEEAADRCGLLYPNYQPIESGRINVTATTLARLADGFGVDPGELLAIRDEAPPSSPPRRPPAKAGKSKKST